YPFAYGLAVKNVEANGLKNVKVINAGVAGNDGSIRVTASESFAYDDLKPSQEGVEVPIYSLDRVIEEYGPFDAVKMDCEGCEYDALANSRRIGEVSQVMLEYHYGPERVEEALRRAGFQVRADTPHKVYNLHAADPNTLVGYVYAWRRSPLASSDAKLSIAVFRWFAFNMSLPLTRSITLATIMRSCFSERMIGRMEAFSGSA
ncbi:MAG: FkbM family methyltransferase, partial [Thermoprotei archaeon]